jgi:hypothetical protein
MNDWVVATVAASTIEAELIVGLLRSNGLEAVVSADDAGGLEPQFQLTAGVRVLVRRDDRSEALRVLTTAEGSP